MGLIPLKLLLNEWSESDNSYLFSANFTSVINCIKSISKCLLASGTKEAFRTFASKAMFVSFVITTEWALHRVTKNYDKIGQWTVAP